MKKLAQKFLALMLCITVIMGLAACTKKVEEDPGEKTKEATTTPAPKKDTPAPKEKKDESKIINGVDVTKKTNLVGYLLGAAPAGMDLVVEELNKKMEKDINTTIEFRYISWGDLSAKYPLVLAGGDDVDFIYTANWAFYAQEATKGAFHEITEADMEAYMPRHYENVDPAAFDQARINGKMYMVTTSSPDKKIGVAVIRGDLRKKYGLDPITKFSEIEPYLKAIKDNEPNMIPMFLDSSFDIMNPFGSLVTENSKGYRDLLGVTGSGSGVFWSIEDANPQLQTIFEGESKELHIQAGKTMQSWYKAGYLNQDAFANKVRSKDSFIQGKSAVGFGNSQDIQSVLAAGAKNNWDIEVIPLLNKNGHYLADPYINNGVAIAASSKNKERTMLAIDLMLEEESYNNLVYFGVEDVNYVVKDGKIALPDGVTAETNTYPPDAAGFWFTNKNQHLPLASWDDAYIALRNEIRNGDTLVDHPLSGFAPKTEEIQTEVANLNQTIVQYLQPIALGMVKDVEESFENFEKKLKAAGIEKVRENLQGQMDAYLSQLN